MFPYLEGEAVKDKTITLTIKDIKNEELKGHAGKKETKEVLYFQETPKGFVLNKTNAKRIGQMYGAMTGAWEGKQITLTTEPVQAFGELHNALRVAPGIISPKNDDMTPGKFFDLLSRTGRVKGFYATPDEIIGAIRKEGTSWPEPDDIDGWRNLFEDARNHALETIDQAVENGDISPDEVPEQTELEELYPDILGKETGGE
jgi:hypothetical protein